MSPGNLLCELSKKDTFMQLYTNIPIDTNITLLVRDVSNYGGHSAHK